MIPITFVFDIRYFCFAGVIMLYLVLYIRVFVQ